MTQWTHAFSHTRTSAMFPLSGTIRDLRCSHCKTGPYNRPVPFLATLQLSVHRRMVWLGWGDCLNHVVPCVAFVVMASVWSHPRYLGRNPSYMWGYSLLWKRSPDQAVPFQAALTPQRKHAFRLALWCLDHRHFLCTFRLYLDHRCTTAVGKMCMWSSSQTVSRYTPCVVQFVFTDFTSKSGEFISMSVRTQPWRQRWLSSDSSSLWLPRPGWLRIFRDSRIGDSTDGTSTKSFFWFNKHEHISCKVLIWRSFSL